MEPSARKLLGNREPTNDLLSMMRSGTTARASGKAAAVPSSGGSTTSSSNHSSPKNSKRYLAASSNLSSWSAHTYTEQGNEQTKLLPAIKEDLHPFFKRSKSLQDLGVKAEEDYYSLLKEANDLTHVERSVRETCDYAGIAAATTKKNKNVGETPSRAASFDGTTTYGQQSPNTKLP